MCHDRHKEPIRQGYIIRTNQRVYVRANTLSMFDTTGMSNEYAALCIMLALSAHNHKRKSSPNPNWTKRTALINYKHNLLHEAVILEGPSSSACQEIPFIS
jgi:hypothetical protein